MRFVYATDLHGNRIAIEQVLRAAEKVNADAVIFGGDLTPKSVAIELAQYSDREYGADGLDDEPNSSAYKGGEIIPLAMLHESAEGSKTFTDSLIKIRALNNLRGGLVTADRFEREGHIINHVTSQYFNFEDMLAEQLLLDKLFAFFEGTASGKGLLSEKELDLFNDTVVVWMKSMEATLSEDQKKKLLEIYSRGLYHSFSDYSSAAPSRFIKECLLYAESALEVHGLLAQMDGWLTDAHTPLEKYVRDRISALREHIIMAANYKTIIRGSDIAKLAPYTDIARLKQESLDEGFMRKQQALFLTEYFIPLIARWKQEHPVPVYAMLSNDDIIENNVILEAAQENGILMQMHNACHRQNGWTIAGYAFVDSLPEKVTYRKWEKEPAVILGDLERLHEQSGNERVIWVIHNPPYGCLDACSIGPVGSQAVLEFLNDHQPAWALFGHIHEAPRLLNRCTTDLGKTKCVNPGGEHSEGAQMVLIDTDTGATTILHPERVNP